MDANTTTVIVSLTVSVIAPTLLAVMTNWNRSKEKIADWKRQDEVSKRAESVALKLSENEALNSSKLVALQDTANITHAIVNHQRTMLLNLNADLRERIARENPKDKKAQEAAKEARREAVEAAQVS